MIEKKMFPYKPDEHEAEKASNSYLMSLIVLIVGVPLPIVNLIATVIFYIGNRKSTYFVRWHCIQALLTQLSLLIVNTAAFWWTISIIFRGKAVTNAYVAYIISVLLLNLIEFIGTMYSAIHTRKGTHVQWWFYGGITQLICKPRS